ncbi:MAG TPA: hypothetical protein DDW91_17240 [Shewanella frigidimarina]|nr:hypothetical protein [Shewanella frigidimarina]
MTISLAKSVIGHELKTHPEHILSALRQGVDALPLKEQLVKLRFNQADAELVNQCYSAEQLQKNQWQIDIDPTLANGDCMIESVRSAVDLRVEQRISQVFSELDAQSNQLAKNVQQQKSTHPQYQTTAVDNLSEHQQAAELAGRTDSTENADRVEIGQSDVEELGAEMGADTVTETLEQQVDASSAASIDAENTFVESADAAATLETSTTYNTSAPLNTNAQADTSIADKVADAQQQTKDLSQGNTDEHSST